jgi:pimeloyl-ACP methyl ester carboxylesterase
MPQCAGMSLEVHRGNARIAFVPEPSIRYARTVDGLHIAYQVVGDGPVDFVYAPGWFSNLEHIWEMPELADFLRELARSYRLILFDRRGFGLSDWPITTDSFALELGMDDVRAVMDAAQSERAVLFGFDDGGALSTLFAASYPDRVVGLVLFAVWAKYYASSDYPWGWTEEEAEEWWQLVDRHWGTETFWEANSAIVAPAIREDRDRVRAWAKYSRLSASPGAALAIERTQRETDIRAVLPAVTVPTLVMHRINDAVERVEQARYIGDQMPNAQVVELPGEEHAPFAGDTSEVLATTRRFVSSIGREEADLDRVLATVLFTDLVGSTERAAALGDSGWRQLVERHHAVVRGLLVRFRGVEVDTAGDGFFATFDGPARAVRCGQAIIEAVRPLGIDVRAGVHTGEVETINGKAGGIAVNIGARVASSAAPRELLVSSTVKDLTAGSGLVFEDAGQHELKGIPEAWRLFRVLNAAT